MAALSRVSRDDIGPGRHAFASTLSWPSLSPHQAPDFIEWLEGQVFGATVDDLYLLYDGASLRAAGSAFQWFDGLRLVVEFPRGPAVADRAALLEFVERFRRTWPETSLVIEPYMPFNEKLLADLRSIGFYPTGRPWIEHTVVVDLQRQEDSIFADFSPTTRRIIRYAIKEGATFRVAQDHSDLEWFSRNQSEMAVSAGITPTSLTYLSRACCSENVESLVRGTLYLMEHDGRRIAGALVLHTERRGFYQKGYAERTSLGTQFLQWSIIKYLAANGVAEYDLGGTGGVGSRDGVTMFKRGFHEECHMMPTLRCDPPSLQEFERGSPLECRDSGTLGANMSDANVNPNARGYLGGHEVGLFTPADSVEVPISGSKS